MRLGHIPKHDVYLCNLIYSLVLKKIFLCLFHNYIVSLETMSYYCVIVCGRHEILLQWFFEGDVLMLTLGIVYC